MPTGETRPADGIDHIIEKKLGDLVGPCTEPISHAQFHLGTSEVS
jgi:hypothetical protein